MAFFAAITGPFIVCILCEMYSINLIPDCGAGMELSTLCGAFDPIIIVILFSVCAWALPVMATEYAAIESSAQEIGVHFLSVFMI